MHRTRVRSAGPIPRLTTLRQRRGAVFLLAIYFTSLMLLTLGGVAMQRTMTDMRAAQVSTQLAQAYWGSEAAYDESFTDLRASTLPPPDSLGCHYFQGTFDPKLPQRTYYMFCQESDTQYQAEMLGTSGSEATPVWASAFVERQIPQVTLNHALVGLEGLTLSHATIGGINSLINPPHLDRADQNRRPRRSDLETDRDGDFFPKLTGKYDNMGHVATRSSAEGAVNILNQSQVIGDVMAGTTGSISISSDSANVETQTKVASAELTTLPAIRVPSGAKPLTSVLASSQASVGSSGQVKLNDTTVTLPAGTYTTGDLTVKESDVQTSGEVNLFVQGSLTVSKSMMLGQEPTLPATDFYPANLKIFITPTDEEDRVLIEKGAVVAGVLYAPGVPVVLKRKPLVLGAIVSKTAEVGLLPTEFYAYTEAARGSQVYYDEALRATPLRPSPEMYQPRTLFYRVNKSVSEVVQRSSLEQQRIRKWFEFIQGRNPPLGTKLLASLPAGVGIIAPPPPAAPPAPPAGPPAGGGGGLGGRWNSTASTGLCGRVSCFQACQRDAWCTGLYEGGMVTKNPTVQSDWVDYIVGQGKISARDGDAAKRCLRSANCMADYQYVTDSITTEARTVASLQQSARAANAAASMASQYAASATSPSATVSTARAAAQHAQEQATEAARIAAALTAAASDNLTAGIAAVNGLSLQAMASTARARAADAQQDADLAAAAVKTAQPDPPCLATNSCHGGSVICTELFHQGYLPAAWYQADMAFGRAYADQATFAVYHHWGKPVVWAMQRSPLVTQLVKPFGRAWAQHMAYVMGATDHDSTLGWWLTEVGLPLHRAAARLLLN